MVDEEYACIRCDGGTYAITNTCAANALEMIDDGDYSLANTESAKISMKKLGEEMGVSFFEAAQSIIQTSSFEIMKTVTRILKDYKMDSATEIIGGGGGASVLAPFVAKQMGAPYRKAEQAEVISSVGVALSHAAGRAGGVDGRPHAREDISGAQQGPGRPGGQGGDPRVDSHRQQVHSGQGHTQDHCRRKRRDGGWRGKERLYAGRGEGEGRPRSWGRIRDAAEIIFKSDHYFVFGARVKEKRLLGKKEKRRVVALDIFGRPKVSIRNGEVFCGDQKTVAGSLDAFFDSKHFGIMPGVYLVNSLKAMDFSGLTSRSHIMAAVSGELADGGDGIVVVDMS